MNPGAVARFQDAQRALLDETYLQAWRQGRDSYEPDEDPAAPEQAHEQAIAIGAGAALLAARRRRYRAPISPDAKAQAAALAPAHESLRKMVDEPSALAPSAEHVEKATEAAFAGEVAGRDIATYAESLALEDWLDSNAWRMNAGESVAWAGEQQGYAQAADVDGQLLEWLPEADDHVCADCEGLGALPPMPLSDWPTTPGAGDTECHVGCRCVLQTADHQTLPDGEPLALSEDEEQLVSRIAEAREPRDLPELA